LSELEKRFAYVFPQIFVDFSPIYRFVHSSICSIYPLWIYLIFAIYHIVSL